MKIASCKITPGEFTNKVEATFEDGTTKFLFDYFHDELSFDASELIGLTELEAQDLFCKKNIAYLRS